MNSDRPVLLLTGRPGVGKTTAIRKVVAQLGANAGGFYTREVRAGGKRSGFEIVTLAGQTDYLATTESALAFSHELPFGKYRVNLEAIDTLAVPALLRALAQGRVVVIDEIGPMELLSKRFCRAVLELLNSQAAVLGTIMQRPHHLADQVKAHPRVTVREVTFANRDRLPAQIYGQFSQRWAA